MNGKNFVVIAAAKELYDHICELVCRLLYFDAINNNNIQTGVIKLFQSEKIIYPGYMEIDDLNCKAMIYTKNNEDNDKMI